MNAESIAVADKIVEVIRPLILATSGFSTANVARQYDVKYDLGKILGLQVPVFPTMYGDDSEATREETYFDVSGYMIVAERYVATGAAPLIPNDWMDTRINLIESTIFVPLSKIEYPLLVVNDCEYWKREIKVQCVFDERFYREQKVFWSEITYTYRKLRVR